MKAYRLHPFCLDVRACAKLPGRFEWTVARKGRSRHRSQGTYLTFEEARAAGQGVLRDVVADWQVSELLAPWLHQAPMQGC